MQAYYRHARVVEQTAERMIARARHVGRSVPARREDLGRGVLRFGDEVTFHDSEELAREPVLALRLYAEVAKRGLPPYTFARDAVARATVDADWCERLEAAGVVAALPRRRSRARLDSPLEAAPILQELARGRG